jgi:hypothetical protein
MADHLRWKQWQWLGDRPVLLALVACFTIYGSAAVAVWQDAVRVACLEECAKDEAASATSGGDCRRDASLRRGPYSRGYLSL